MKVNKLISLIVVGGMIFMSGCSTKGNNDNDDDKKDDLTPYEEIYDGLSKEKHEIVTKLTDFNRASYGYRFNDVQGYNNWRYIEINKATNGVSDLFYDTNKWNGIGADFDNGIFNCNDGYKAGYSYNIPKSGNYTFGGTFATLNAEKTAKLEIYLDDLLLGQYEVDASIENGRYFEISQECNANANLLFLVEGKQIYLNPTIVQGTSLADSLYNPDTPWGYYGDIHCYYYNNKLYMFHLCDVPQWTWYCKTTTDMFRFYDSGYDDSFVNNHYMAYGKAPDVLDRDIYSKARDCTYFYDEEVERYRCIGLGYRNDAMNGQISCDLFLRTSSDKLGFEWNEHSIALRSFPLTSDGEPECSQLIKIGKRWYLTAGISGQSIHGVGTCSYWYGEENQTIDEINWQSLPTNKLDGEDLSVPQIEKVKDRYYFFGWTPYRFNSNHWGGNKNLAREVFVKEDGSLGTRIDEMATKLLDKGRLFDVNEQVIDSKANTVMTNGNTFTFNGAGEIKLNKQINHTFIKYHVKLNEANTVSYKLYGPAYPVNISIQKKSDDIYLEVNHDNGFVSSNVYLCKDNVDEFDVKLVVEDEKVEFAVNDTIVLTAMTMNNGLYTPAFVSDGACEISNISINRLAQFYDIYD